jgi:hypothetical protein
LEQLGIYPVDHTRTTVYTFLKKYRAQVNQNSNLLTAQADVIIANTPRAWRLLAGMTMFPWTQDDDPEATHLLGFRLIPQQTSARVNLPDTFPRALLNSYLHAGGFQQEHASRFYSSILRASGYNVWWVMFDDATLTLDDGVPRVIPWHHIEGGMRIIFPDEDSMEQALMRQSSQGEVHINLWHMTTFCPHFSTVQPQMTAMFPSFTEVNLRRTFLPFSFRASPTRLAGPTALNIPEQERSRTVVMFPSTREVQAILKKHGRNVGSVRSALHEFLTQANIPYDRIVLSYYLESNEWHSFVGIAFVMPTRNDATTLLSQLGTGETNNADPVAGISGDALVSNNQRTRAYMADELTFNAGNPVQHQTTGNNARPIAGRGRGRATQVGNRPAPSQQPHQVSDRVQAFARNREQLPAASDNSASAARNSQVSISRRDAQDVVQTSSRSSVAPNAWVAPPQNVSRAPANTSMFITREEYMAGQASVHDFLREILTRLPGVAPDAPQPRVTRSISRASSAQGNHGHANGTEGLPTSDLQGGGSPPSTGHPQNHA